MMKFIFKSLFIYLFAYSASQAADLKDVLTLTLIDNPSKDERIKIARILHAECEELLKSVPVLSPKEQEWLNNELNSGRAESLLRTPEFSKHMLRNFFSTCTEGTNVIINSDDTNRESLGWSILLVTLIDQDISYHMNQSQLKYPENKARTVSATFNITAAPILKNILIPMLASNSVYTNKSLNTDSQR